jgi:GT2 family glycosyltransferase
MLANYLPQGSVGHSSRGHRSRSKIQSLKNSTGLTRMLDLSIIIVSYNTKKLTLACIDSIRKHTKGVTYEIVVVDNNSTDGSLEELEKLTYVRLIRNKENKGFGAANNIGLKVATAKYLLLLNSDTIILDNVLGEMVSWMLQHPKVGVASTALKNEDGTMQGTGGYFPTLGKVFAWMCFLEDIPLLDQLIKPFHPVHGQSPFYTGARQFMNAKQQDWVTGAFMLIPKKVIDEVGMFDEDYFMYTEEVDLCFRIKKKGWEVWYLPQFSIIHLGGSSSTKEFPLLQEYKSMKLFYQKNMSKWQFPVLRFLLKVGALLRILLLGILKGKDMARIYWKAFNLS